MKVEEAIQILKDIYPSQKQIVTGEYPHVAESIDLAMQALEKQTPIPPENRVHEQYPALGKNHYCKCGVMFMDWENQPTNYCGNCGQRLREVESETKNKKKSNRTEILISHDPENIKEYRRVGNEKKL